jgi:hypothetical protein
MGLMFDPSVSGERKMEALLQASGGWLGVQDDSDINFEIVLFAEAFYNIAWRLLLLCKKDRLPGLAKVKPLGITRVRNELLVHPEETTGLVEGSFSMRLGGDGPTLKTNRPSTSKAFSDPGLYVNAEEFRDDLEGALKAYLARS